MVKKDFYTTSEVAKILHVAVGSVINWVDDGKLKAIITPGGHRKIPYNTLTAFLKEHNYELSDNFIPTRLIYLVDDEDSTHSFFRKIFEKVEKTNLNYFYSGTEALIAIGKQVPNMIVVDILMPDIDGIQVIKHIKSKPELTNVNVIAISADITKKDLALKAGANLFMKKPFNMNEFNETIVNGIT